MSSKLVAIHTAIRPSILPISHSTNIENIRTTRTSKAEEVEKKIYTVLADLFAPATVIINSNNEVIFSHGNYRAMLIEKSGFYKNDFFSAISDNIKAETRALVYKARRTLKTENSGTLRLSINNKMTNVKLSVKVLGNTFPDWISISFEVIEPLDTTNKNDVNTDQTHLLQLEQELSATRESLQTVVEELENANEQLQVYNEELQSANEEFQSTNEELQTVNEELQSTNEELLTINDENAVKTIKYLRISNDLTNIQEAINLPIIVINTELRIRRFTQNCQEIVDINRLKLNDYIYALDWLADLKDLKMLIDDVCKNKQTLKHLFCVNNEYYECQVSPYFNIENKFDGCVIVFYDVSKAENNKKELKIAKAVAQATLETIVEGVIRVDENLIIDYANPSSAEALGWQTNDIVGHHIDERLKLLSDNEHFDLAGKIQDCIKENVHFQTDTTPFKLFQKFGNKITVELSIAPMSIDIDQSFGAVLAFRDVSVRQSHVNNLEWRSKHDALTSLVNRHEIERRIQQMIDSAKTDNVVSSFLYLDLDQFKVINDTCGHRAGDELLKQLGQVMIEMLRSRDSLGRIGGDEFAVLLEKCNLIEAQAIAKKIQAAISDYRFSWENQCFRVGVSIGITLITNKSNQVSEILSDADAACYAAKESGRNCIQTHGLDDAELNLQRSQMRSIADINDAIENHRFILYFQEIKPLDEQQTSSWEVLIRMFNKNAEFLLPECFLPAAERFGLIQRIDHWVLENTLRKLSLFIEKQPSLVFPKININLSGMTVGDETYIERLLELINTFRIEPDKLTFELTETTAMSNFVKARAFMLKINEIGCNFALDDFGTGMSSLSYLRDLSLNAVKIDASFVSDIDNDIVKSAIVSSVAQVAHLLNMKVIAEGVENEAQLTHLHSIGVDAVQGYYVNKPLPFAEFALKAMTNLDES